MEANQELAAALDALDKADVSLRPADLGADYIKARPHLEALLGALENSGGELARVGNVIEHLMAGAETVVIIPSHSAGDEAVLDISSAEEENP